MLCENRFHLSGSPSTCALDTAVVPLPSFLALFPLLYILAFHQVPRKCIPKRWIHLLYQFLVIAAFAISLLEIIRLGIDRLGVGLLPVNTITFLLALLVLFKERGGRTLLSSEVLMGYWTLLLIFLSVKVARLHLLETSHPTPGSKYPSSDQFLDNAVLLGLIIGCAIVELISLVKFRSQIKNISVVQ